MLKNVFIGIKVYFGVFRLISKLKLWKYFVIPMLIRFLTALFIFVFAIGFLDNIANYLSSLFLVWPCSSWLKIVLQIIIGLSIIVIGLILYKHIIMALSAPFMSLVSEKIENHLVSETTIHRKTSFAKQLWRGIRINIRNLSLELLLTIPILLLGFILFIGVATLSNCSFSKTS